MRVTFNNTNPNFSECYKLPRTEIASWEKVLKSNLDKNNQWEGICSNVLTSINCGISVGSTYITKKAGSVMYFEGNHGLDHIIQEAIIRFLRTGPSKEERKLLNLPRIIRASELSKQNELIAYRRQKAKEFGIDDTKLFEESKKDGIYIFTGKDDAQDYFDYITKMSYEFSKKYTLPKRSFWQKLADKFQPKKLEAEGTLPAIYRHLKEIVDEDNYQQQIFDKFISGKEVKEFNTADELAKEIFPA